jgi:hypothetical protein
LGANGGPLVDLTPNSSGDATVLSLELFAGAGVGGDVGGFGEGVAAELAARRSKTARDPVIRSVLANIAVDEARHAELGWHTAAWCLRTGGAPARRAIADATASASRVVFSSGDPAVHNARRVVEGRLRRRALAMSDKPAACRFPQPRNSGAEQDARESAQSAVGGVA